MGNIAQFLDGFILTTSFHRFAIPFVNKGFLLFNVIVAIRKPEKAGYA